MCDHHHSKRSNMDRQKTRSAYFAYLSQDVQEVEDPNFERKLDLATAGDRPLIK